MLGRAIRLVQAQAARRRTRLRERGEEIPRRPIPEAGHAGEGSRLRGRAQGGHAVDARLGERADLREAEPGHLAQLEHAARERSAQVLEEAGPPGTVELGDDGGEAPADAGNGGEPRPAHHLVEVAGERLDRARTARVGAHARRLAAARGQELPDLAERAGDVEAVRGASY